MSPVRRRRHSRPRTTAAALQELFFTPEGRSHAFDFSMKKYSCIYIDNTNDG